MPTRKRTTPDAPQAAPAPAVRRLSRRPLSWHPVAAPVEPVPVDDAPADES